jgi:hypothetical protein
MSSHYAEHLFFSRLFDIKNPALAGSIDVQKSLIFYFRILIYFLKFVSSRGGQSIFNNQHTSIAHLPRFAQRSHIEAVKIFSPKNQPYPQNIINSVGKKENYRMKLLQAYPLLKHTSRPQ